MKISFVLSRILFLSIGAVTGLAATSAHAQWIWKDETNHTVISDQPPPKNIPLKDILKAPRSTPVPQISAVPADGSAIKSDAKKDEGPKTVAEKEADYKKRQKENADASKKQEEEASKAKADAERCKALRSNMASLQSGIRIARTNEKGEREILDDSQRQAEVDRSKKESADCK